MQTLKKLKPASFLELAAVLLGVAGTVLLILCGTMDYTYSLSAFPLLLTAAVAGIILILAAVITPLFLGSQNIVSTVSILAGIACFTFVIGDIFSERAMMISGLMTWNAQNTAGWNVFYMTIACAVCLGISILIMIVSAFMDN